MPSPLIYNNDRTRVDLQESARYITTKTNSHTSLYLPFFKPASFKEKFLLKAQGRSFASDLQSFPGGPEPPTTVDPELTLDGPARHEHGKFSSRFRAVARALTLTEAHLAMTGLWFPLQQVFCQPRTSPVSLCQ